MKRSAWNNYPMDSYNAQHFKNQKGNLAMQSTEYEGMICPHCGEQTGIDPALCEPDQCTFCPHCNEQIFFEDPNEDSE